MPFPSSLIANGSNMEKKTEWVCFNWETLQFQVQDQQEIMQSIKTNYIQRGDKIVQNEYYCDLRVKVRQLLRSP